MSEARVMELLIALAAPDGRRDPLPIYRALVDELPPGALPGNRFEARHAIVETVLRDDRFGHQQQPDRPPETVFLTMNPPEHTRLRSMVTRPFTPRSLRAWRERIERVVAALIDRAIDSGSMDVVDDFAYPTPLTVICELLGAPEEDHDRLRAWSRTLAPTLDPLQLTPDQMKVMEEAEGEFRAWAGELAGRKRVEPGEDVVTDLVAQRDAGALTDGELEGTCLMLLFAGHETTVNLISTGVHELIRDGDAWKRLVADPGLAASATEELMRFVSPVQITSRTALADVELGGETIPAGEQVLVVLALANRDPDVFTDPNTIVLDRTPNPQVGFGAGIHHCLGAPLARLEGEIAFRALATRLPGLRLAEDEPPWRSTVVLRGLQHLRVEW